MTADILDATTLGYLSGVLGLVIALALVVSLTIVNALLANVGGNGRGHVQAVAGSLSAVADSTAPVPPVLTGINKELGELAGVLISVQGHMNVARSVFEANGAAR